MDISINKTGEDTHLESQYITLDLAIEINENLHHLENQTPNNVTTPNKPKRFGEVGTFVKGLSDCT